MTDEIVDQSDLSGPEVSDLDDGELTRVLEALLLVVDSPVTPEALASATGQPMNRVTETLRRMASELA